MRESQNITTQDATQAVEPTAVAEQSNSHRLQLSVCGLNHVHAELALREHFALSPQDSERTLRRLLDSGLCDQALVLSTCNRTELYAFGAEPDHAARLKNEFLALGGDAAPAVEPPPIYEYQGIEAVRHLFAVTAGLDSMILGENQIKQQVREAVELSRAAGACGADLNRLIEAGFHAGKCIRTETDLNTGTLCVAKAAVLKAEQALGTLAGKVCVVIGAGKIGRIAARVIGEQGPARLYIINRTPEHAGFVAQELGAESYGLDALACVLPEAEFILGAAYAPELLLSRDDYEAACSGNNRPAHCCMVDAAVPRILDPALSTLHGIDLFDIEQLEEIIEDNRRRRQTAAEQAWRIIDEEVENYRSVMQSAELAPIIQRLRERFDRIFDEEQNQLQTTLGHPLDKKNQSAQRRIKQRLLHEAITQVKALVEQDRMD